MRGDSGAAGHDLQPGPPAGPRRAWLLFVAGAVVSSFPKAFSSEWVFFSRDIHAYWHPMVATFVRVIADGDLPLWDAYEAFGQPLWADPGAQTGYPPTWLSLLLLPHTVYKILVLGHVLAAGMGVFALLRRWRIGLLPAAAAAVAFACSGPLVSAGSLIHHLCGAAWIPWVLWAVEGVLATGSRREVALLATVLGGQALAGSAEMCAVGGLAALLRWLTLAGGRWGLALRRLTPLSGSAAIAFLIAALQWIPTMSILGRSSRAGFPSEMKLFWSVHPATLVDMIVPRLVSEMSMGAGPRQVLYGSREPFLQSLYLGVATLPLVLLAVRSDRPQRRFIALSFGFFFALALGSHFLPARVVLSLPPLSLFRYPAKYLLPAALFWALLTGLGAEVWWRRWSRRDRVYGGALAGILLGLALALAHTGQRLMADARPLLDAFEVAEPWRAWMALLASRKLQASATWLGLAAGFLLVRSWRPEWSRVSAVSAVVVLAADLTAAARPVNPMAPAALFAHRPPLLDSMLPFPHDARLLSVGGALSSLNRDLTRGPAGWDAEWRWTLGLQEMIIAPLGTRWGLRGSYDADFTGLAPPALPAMSRLVRQVETTPVGVRLLQMGNVGWLIDPRPAGSPLVPEVAQAMSVFSHAIRLHRVPDPLPPCYLVGAATRVSSEGEALTRLVAPDFDPRREVVLTGRSENRNAPPGFRGAARYLIRKANHLRIETDTSAPGLLVIVEAFDPDWRATIDGTPTTVERANVLFRGVEVPAGRHQVDLRYFPRPIAWGMGLAALGLVCIGVLLRPPSARGGGPAGTPLRTRS